MNVTRTKYDKLWAVFEEFSTAIAGFDDPVVSQLPAFWASAKIEYEKLVQSGVRKSQIAAGLEQGLREVPEMLNELPYEQRLLVLSALRRAVMTHFPEFYEKDGARLAAMIKRSKITKESDYYLARHRIDELEGRADHSDELTQLYRLVDRFES